MSRLNKERVKSYIDAEQYNNLPLTKLTMMADTMNNNGFCSKMIISSGIDWRIRIAISAIRISTETAICMCFYLVLQRFVDKDY